MQENQIPQTEVNQSFSNPVIQTEQQPKQNNFLVVLLSILLIISVSITGFFAFQTQKLVKELTELKAQEKVVAVATTEPVATESSTSVTQIPGWKFYVNKELTFQYPGEWTLGQAQTALVSDMPGVGITVFDSKSPMYNECMELDKTDAKNGLMIKYYSYTLNGERCSNQKDVNNKQIWITKINGDGFQPGIIYMYDTGLSPKSINAFDQILSTFKFTN
jgi:hypothetical protein